MVVPPLANESARARFTSTKQEELPFGCALRWGSSKISANARHEHRGVRRPAAGIPGCPPGADDAHTRSHHRLHVRMVSTPLRSVNAPVEELLQTAPSRGGSNGNGQRDTAWRRYITIIVACRFLQPPRRIFRRRLLAGWPKTTCLRARFLFGPAQGKRNDVGLEFNRHQRMASATSASRPVFSPSPLSPSAATMAKETPVPPPLLESLDSNNPDISVP